jgi:hypothetical protein
MLYCERRYCNVRGDVVLRGVMLYCEGRYCTVRGDVVL